MRGEDNGKLTHADRQVLNQQQKHLSKQIYQANTTLRFRTPIPRARFASVPSINRTRSRKESRAAS